MLEGHVTFILTSNIEGNKFDSFEGGNSVCSYKRTANYWVDTQNIIYHLSEGLHHYIVGCVSVLH